MDCHLKLRYSPSNYIVAILGQIEHRSKYLDETQVLGPDLMNSEN